MDIRKYFGKKTAIEDSSLSSSKSHNTRKKTSIATDSKKGGAEQQDKKSSKRSKRSRIAIISDSSDDDVQFVEETTPSKKLKPSVEPTTTTTRSSPRHCAKAESKSNSSPHQLSSATEFFGSKVINSGSKTVTATEKSNKDPKKLFSCETNGKNDKRKRGQPAAEEPVSKKSARAEAGLGGRGSNVGGRGTNGRKVTSGPAVTDEIMLVDESADMWSDDDESFAKLIEDDSKKQSGRLIEDHADSGFNSTLQELDRSKSLRSPSSSTGQSHQTPSPASQTSKSARSPRHHTPTKPTSHRDKVTTTPTTPRNNATKSTTLAKHSNATKTTVLNKHSDTSTSSSAHSTIGGMSLPSKHSATSETRVKNLKGITFVITGQLDRMERDEAKELIVKYEGRVVSAVSGKVNYLVAGSEAGESKLAKAQKSKLTKIISEEEFFDMVSDCESRGESSSVNSKSPTATSPQKSKQLSTISTTKTSHTSKSQPTAAVAASVKDTNGGGSTEPSFMWVDKYKPTSMNKIIGQSGDKSNAKKLYNWLLNWEKHRRLGTKPASNFGRFGGDPTGAGHKAALLSGPPGIGKTTTATLVCQEAGFTYFEMNASDSRSKRVLDETVGQALNSRSLDQYSTAKSHSMTTAMDRHSVIMDEVDGMAGNEDRGGIVELIKMIKTTRIPIICICNDRQSQKIRSLANHCFDLRFPRPRVDQIKAAIMSICFKEGLGSISSTVLSDVIEASNHDIRQTLHNLSVWTAADTTNSNNQTAGKTDQIESAITTGSSNAKKDMKLDAFTACRQAFSESETSRMSIKDKSDLFFYDYSLHPLFIQENYIHAVPHSLPKNADRCETIHKLAKASSYIAMGDVISKTIRTDKWSLLPMQAMFSSVMPADAVMGHLSKMIDFPRWLGKFSTTNKNRRLNQELSMHMALGVTGNARSICLDYLPVLRDKLTLPLAAGSSDADSGGEAISEVLSLMQEYELLRDDYDSIIELTQWPNLQDVKSLIQSKTKAAFTRGYNKLSHKTHYSTNQLPAKKRGTASAAAAVDGEEEAQQVESDEESDTALVNALRVNKKPSTKSTAKSASTKKNSSAKPAASKSGRRQRK